MTTAPCANCGAPLQAGQRFCTSCGARAGVAVPAPAPAAAEPPEPAAPAAAGATAPPAEPSTPVAAAEPDTPAPPAPVASSAPQPTEPAAPSEPAAAAPAPDAPAPEPVPAPAGWEELKPKLEKALEDSRVALDEAEAGRLDEAALQKRLFETGLVVHDGKAWMLDLEHSRWAIYDGVEVRFQPFEP